MILEANCGTGAQVDQNSRSNLKIPDASVVTWTKCHTEDTDFRSDLRTSHLTDAFSSARVK
jgi:hypothetical protein